MPVNLSHNEGGRILTLLAVTAATIAMLLALSLDDIIQDIAREVKPDKYLPRGVGGLIVFLIAILPWLATAEKSGPKKKRKAD